MHIYKFSSHEGDEQPVYLGVMRSAWPQLGAYEPVFRCTCKLELLDVDTTKDGVLAMLNGGPEYRVLRTWQGTARGGWKELT
jgi:hypothetical protein